jgi:hypothetical protein
MLDQSNKDKSKKLLNEAISILDDKAEIGKDIQKILKGNEEYQAALRTKKEVEEEEKALKEKLVGSLEDEKTILNDNLKLVKDDLTETLQIDKSATNKLIGFFKIKYEQDKDELDQISTAWLEIGLDDELE